MKTLSEISGWRTAGIASQVISSINGEFLVSLSILEKVLKETIVVAQAQQKEDIDLIEAMKEVEDLLATFRSWRDGDVFNSLFEV